MHALFWLSVLTLSVVANLFGADDMQAYIMGSVIMLYMITEGESSS